MSKFLLNYTGEEVDQILNCQKHSNFNTLIDMKTFSDICPDIKEGLLCTCTETPEIIYVYYSTNENSTATGKFKDINSNLKTSILNSKQGLANAITARGVSTSANADFATMISNISKISTGMKMASGSYSYNTGVVKGGTTGSIPVNLSFTPKYAFLVAFVGSYTSSSGTAGAYSEIVIPSTNIIANPYVCYGSTSANYWFYLYITGMSSSAISYKFEPSYSNRYQRVDLRSWYAFG